MVLDQLEEIDAARVTPEAMEDPGRPPWRRSLPWVIGLICLALGIWIGSTLVGSGPVSSKALVTPAQVDVALSATSATKVDDRGFSLLENGVQHSHGFQQPVAPADQALLSHQMDLARQVALEYPTLADAQAAGAFRAGPFSPGLGTHMIMPADFAYGAGSNVMTDEQIRHPLAWIYGGTKPSSPVVGLFYQGSVASPAGFAGTNDVWHQHRNICLVTKAGGGIDAPLGADRDVTKAQCDVVHGSLLKATGPLLHVWAVPGWEDPQGVFAHLNPAITCQDGSYRTVDVSALGSRTTACLDGLE